MVKRSELHNMSFPPSWCEGPPDSPEPDEDLNWSDPRLCHHCLNQTRTPDGCETCGR